MYEVVPAVLTRTYTTKRKNVVPGCSMHCLQGKILPNISGNLEECICEACFVGEAKGTRG